MSDNLGADSRRLMTATCPLSVGPARNIAAGLVFFSAFAAP
jgi:hypothetical protein